MNEDVIENVFINNLVIVRSNQNGYCLGILICKYGNNVILRYVTVIGHTDFRVDFITYNPLQVNQDVIDCLCIDDVTIMTRCSNEHKVKYLEQNKSAIIKFDI